RGPACNLPEARATVTRRRAASGISDAGDDGRALAPNAYVHVIRFAVAQTVQYALSHEPIDREFRHLVYRDGRISPEAERDGWRHFLESGDEFLEKLGKGRLADEHRALVTDCNARSLLHCLGVPMDRFQCIAELFGSVACYSAGCQFGLPCRSI